MDFTSNINVPSPLVRTNPVTGWKSLFGAGQQVEHGWIEDVTPLESEVLKGLCKSGLLPFFE